jgi:hypothetical protein
MARRPTENWGEDDDFDLELLEGADGAEAGVGLGPDGKPLASRELIDTVKRLKGNKILLSFSTGKDSLATWLYLREHFEIYPYYLYWVPGLSWVEEALTYYEEWFGTHIMRMPHPIFYEYLNQFYYQTPERVAVIRALNLPKFDFSDIENILAQWFGLDAPFSAIGMRVADNVDRRNMIFQGGALGLKRRRYYYPIWDWDIAQVAEIILDNGVKLPKDYEFWGRTIAAFDYQYMKPISVHFPADFEMIRQWFPLIDLELMRYEELGHGPKG